MPTYQYACTQCGESLEVAQKFSDEPLTECPACSGVLRKVFSPVGVVFKGSGFYKTDSRTKPKSTSAATTGDAKTSDGTSTKTDSAASDSKSSDSKSPDSKSSDKKSSDKPASGTSTAGSGQVA